MKYLLDTNIINLSAEDMGTLTDAATQFNLDFDDSYQYTAAKKFQLQIISFDKDFDRTDRGRETPAKVLEQGETS